MSVIVIKRVSDDSFERMSGIDGLTFSDPSYLLGAIFTFCFQALVGIDRLTFSDTS